MARRPSADSSPLEELLPATDASAAAATTPATTTSPRLHEVGAHGAAAREAVRPYEALNPYGDGTLETPAQVGGRHRVATLTMMMTMMT
eukprot:6578176-Prymnesium_polylepis.1